VLGVAGLVLISCLPPAVIGRPLLGTGWSLAVLCQVLDFRSGFARCRRLRFLADGTVMIETPGGWQSAGMLPGSLLLRRAGWVRLRLPGQPAWAEPLRGHCRRSPGWRRLQVIWRHVGGGL